MGNARVDINELFNAALGAADPHGAVVKKAGFIRSRYRQGGFSRLVVIGFGKAALTMARAMEEELGPMIDEGAIITGYGQEIGGSLKRIRLHEAGHPIPDENGLHGTRELIRLAGKADEETLAVVLISGGGSALFVSPRESISLAEKQETTSLLLKAGADIREINRVRKHLSMVKGGRLAELLHPAATVSLILSDVIGDPLDVIASGPTSPDPSTYGDALEVMERYGLMERAPGSVLRYLADGAEGLHPETPKEGCPVFARVENRIIGSNRLALEAARMKALELGVEAAIIGPEISGEARAAGRRIARRALDAKRERRGGAPLCLISGGETTVTVTGKGKGGRNMELALAFAMEVEGVPGVTLLSAGTDGIDGPTDAAGAIADGSTAETARERGLNPEDFLSDNDSYNFFGKAGGLLVTGPTGTNVMDMQIVLIE